MSQRYTSPAIVLHWLIALMIFINIGLAWTWDSLPDAQVRGAIDLHKSTGITVLGLVLLRILWRIGHRPPPLPAEYPPAERHAAHWAHLALYALIIGLPLSGWLHDSAWKDAATHPMHWYGLFEWLRIGAIMQLDPAVKEVWHDRFGQLHGALGWVFYGLFALHLAGALKHELIDRKRELRRMWFGPRDASELAPAKPGVNPTR